MELIKSQDLEKKVLIKKSVSNHKIQDYYKSATLFALAYDTELEGTPIPVLEAMASGLPIIISRPKNKKCMNLKDVVMYTERNPESFVKTIKKVLNDDQLQKHLSLRSLNKSKEFDYEVIEKREAKMYQELIQNHKS